MYENTVDFSYFCTSKSRRLNYGRKKADCVSVRPIAVPLFLMASAYLLVPVKKSTGEFLKKRFGRVAIPFMVFLFLYAFLSALWGEFSWAEAWANVKQAGINFIPRESHLWFVYMMLGLYLIMPVISPWLSKASKREEGFFLGLWGVTLCLYLLRQVFGPVFGECWWTPRPSWRCIGRTTPLSPA